MIFVFGSNFAGRHGAGAAKYALKHKGAIYGIGVGPQGQSFAIPTKNMYFRVLDPDIINLYVEEFLSYASDNSQLKFKVTRIGTGLAGISDSTMADMFKNAPDNCYFDLEWEKYLPGKKFWGTF